MPPRRESATMIIALAIWLAVTAMCVGFRPEHLWIAILLAILFFATSATRRLMVALLPFIIFGISYDWMNIVHNYEVNPVDIEGIYNTEKDMFGITCTDGIVRTPNEFFAIHKSPVLDFLGGFFYLCWVPVPILFGLWLYFGGQIKTYLHFAIVFLLVNLIGFAGYYIHPAAPPWYVAKYGFDFILGTPGDTAGLSAFDNMTGLGIFNALYGRNSNVFAAVPSLHSAYTLVAFIYSLRSKSPLWIRLFLAIVTLGIWFTAVYTSHHYIIDVSLGILCALTGFLLFEYVFMRIPAFTRFIDRYAAYVSGGKRN
ncbi:MAG: inositol phosphorylceramide synthase [Bacteroidales bacterium]|nr:inositol phosphorylceramide synthase [Bacteroidales bacterium]